VGGAEPIDPERDVRFTMGPIDVLDHSSRGFTYGSKMGSTRRANGRKRGSRASGPTRSRWTPRRSRLTRCGGSWELSSKCREGQTFAGESSSFATSTSSSSHTRCLLCRSRCSA